MCGPAINSVSLFLMTAGEISTNVGQLGNVHCPAGDGGDMSAPTADDLPRAMLRILSLTPAVESASCGTQTAGGEGTIATRASWEENQRKFRVCWKEWSHWRRPLRALSLTRAVESALTGRAVGSAFIGARHWERSHWPGRWECFHWRPPSRALSLAGPLGVLSLAPAIESALTGRAVESAFTGARHRERSHWPGRRECFHSRRPAWPKP